MEMQPTVAEPETSLPVWQRRPWLAALGSAAFPGAGHIYNRVLDRAVLTMVTGLVLLTVALLMLLAGGLAGVIPNPALRPPIGEWIALRPGLFFGLWLVLWLAFWALAIVDAVRTAEAINAGRIVVRHTLRWQLVHLLGAQLLGLIPFVGFLFSPGIVAESMDAARARRSPDRQRLWVETRAALVEWVLLKIAILGLVVVVVVWLLWYVARVARYLM